MWVKDLKKCFPAGNMRNRRFRGPFPFQRINLAACADISVLDHAMHGRDAERVHRAVHGYVALHPACGGHLRVARRLDVSIVEPNAVSLIAWGSGLLKQAVGPVDSTVAVTGYGG